MAGRSIEAPFVCLLVLLLCTDWLTSLLAQDGFISIGCAWSSRSYTDPRTGILWTSDATFINNLGKCVPFPTDMNSQLRIFPDGIKNCYTLSTLLGRQYLIRGTFHYGNYDKKSKPPTFNISIDATLVFQVSTSQISSKSYEVIVTATNYNLSFCLIRIPNGGTPMISTLEVRPLRNISYFHERSSPILRKLMRTDCGNDVRLYRYPNDPLDRIWDPDHVNSHSIRGKAPLNGTDDLLVPGVVLGTAAYGGNRLEIICEPEDGEPFDYYVHLYFMELDDDAQIGHRVFDIYGNGLLLWKNFDILSSSNFSRDHLLAVRMSYSAILNVSLVPSIFSLLPPSLNALEVYQIVPTSIGTRQEDVEALLAIRDSFKLPHWSGDPCLPLSGDGHPSSWLRLTCSSAYGLPTVIKLNLSSMGLKGPVPRAINKMINIEELVLNNNELVGAIPDFSALSNLITLELQNNEFTGSIPSSLAVLPKLRILYLQNNKLTGNVPPSLLMKIRKENVDFRYSNSAGNEKEPHTNKGTSFNRQFKILVGCFVGGSVFLLLVVVAATYACLYKRQAKVFSTETNKIFQLPPKCTRVIEYRTADVVKTVLEPQEVELKSIHIQQFSLSELNVATNNFSNRIGEGGFGAVYHGVLSDGLAVAVKVRSANSIQGIREFTTELHLLSEIRHENLVPLLGYCRDQQSLVYPYMSNGSLQDRLYGEAARRKPLDWPTRLNIALGAARGLNFLHTAGVRCVIHRDVKSSNILLDNSMVAKVADFGFSKYAPQEGDSMVSLEVRGTAGYLDPEYYSTQQLTVKSDVFSFGVVLLEIICGREPLNIHRPRPEWSLVEWAKPFIQESNIQAIVDSAISSSYTPESMWRVVEIALCSVEPLGVRRPTMADIVRELEDALIIENNASQYMASIESLGSFRMSLNDAKMPSPLPLFYHFDPSPVFSETMGSPNPR